MKKRWCHECLQKVDVYDETVLESEYLCCAECGSVLAEIKFNWELPKEITP